MCARRISERRSDIWRDQQPTPLVSRAPHRYLKCSSGVLLPSMSLPDMATAARAHPPRGAAPRPLALRDRSITSLSRVPTPAAHVLGAPFGHVPPSLHHLTRLPGPRRLLYMTSPMRSFPLDDTASSSLLAVASAPHPPCLCRIPATCPRARRSALNLPTRTHVARYRIAHCVRSKKPASPSAAPYCCPCTRVHGDPPAFRARAVWREGAPGGGAGQGD
ncbi:hypothetical protein B0H10DRAFT_548268 [Mycena sp. CBHHK59/15]|nr:hypothetical protein B0H10DRAFT_548268 [Mycena sp. CBHHK59/15]